MYSSVPFLECLSKPFRLRNRWYWGWKKNGTVQDPGHNEDSLSELKHDFPNIDAPHQNEKTDHQRGTTGSRGSYISNINSSSLSSNKSSGPNALSSQSRYPLTAIPIWHQQPQRITPGFPHSLLTMPASEAAFYPLRLAENHPTTQ